MATLLRERALTSEIVCWALVEPLEVYGAALHRLLVGEDTADVGRLLVERIDPWVERLPIHPVWGTLDRQRFDDELAVADRLLGTPSARRAFRARLVDRFPRVTTIATVAENPDTTPAPVRVVADDTPPAPDGAERREVAR